MMTIARRTRLVPGLALGLALTALTPIVVPALRAQEAAAGVFGEQVEVRVVNVEVVVEDRDGNRVKGLSADDFRLRVDGKETLIDFFSEISGGRLVSRTADTSGAELPAAPSLRADAGDPVGTSYLVFVDDYFTLVARDRNQVLEGIRDSLYRLGPEDRMAIVAFDGRKIQMLTSWSQSQRVLAETLDKAMRRPARGLRSASLVGGADAAAAFDAGSSTSVQDAGADAPSADFQGFGASSREADACATIDFLERQLQRAVAGVTSTLRSFAAPPGRKVALILSGGWPSSAYDYVLGPTQPLARTGECGFQGPSLLRPMYDVANLLGYTLYPVDVPGNSRLSVNADETDDVALARTGPGIEGSSAGLPSASFRKSEERTTLSRLAVETGGRAMLAESRLGALETVYEDTRSYYWLGFTPDWQGDDENHKIKLEVNAPGLSVRYREGFQDLSRSKEIGFMIESALYFGDLPGAKPLGVKLGPVPKRGRRIEVPIELRIPMDEVTMLPYDGRYVAELELRVGAVNAEGERNEISVVPVVLEGRDPPPPGVYATYELAIKVRREPQDLVFALHDPAGDTILAASRELVP